MSRGHIVSYGTFPFKNCLIAAHIRKNVALWKKSKCATFGKSHFCVLFEQKYVLATFCHTQDNAVRKNWIRFENLTVLKIFEEKIDKPGGADLCLLDWRAGVRLSILSEMCVVETTTALHTTTTYHQIDKEQWKKGDNNGKLLWHFHCLEIKGGKTWL